MEVKKEVFYIAPDGNNWRVKQDLAATTSVFPSKEAAWKYAHQEARKLAKSEIVVLDQDGHERYRETRW